jgi:uncharacterized OB-fold protein
MTTTSPPHAPVHARALREGLLQLDPPRLIGSRCAGCGTTQFPARDFCPACRAESGQTHVTLSERGVVFSYTVVHQSPGGRVPYTLAYVDLPEQVRVLAQLEDLNGDLRIGMPVKLKLKAMRFDGDVPVIGYVFVGDGAPASEV